MAVVCWCVVDAVLFYEKCVHRRYFEFENDTPRKKIKSPLDIVLVVDESYSIGSRKDSPHRHFAEFVEAAFEINR